MQDPKLFAAASDFLDAIERSQAEIDIYDSWITFDEELTKAGHKSGMRVGVLAPVEWYKKKALEIVGE